MAIQPLSDETINLSPDIAPFTGPDATATFEPANGSADPMADPTAYASSENLFAAGRKSGLDEEDEVEDDDDDLEDDDALDDDKEADDLEDDEEEDDLEDDDDDLEDEDEDDEDEEDDEEEEEEEEDEE